MKADCFDVVKGTNVYNLGNCKKKLQADASLLVFTRIADNVTQSKTMDI